MYRYYIMYIWGFPRNNQDYLSKNFKYEVGASARDCYQLKKLEIDSKQVKTCQYCDKKNSFEMKSVKKID